MPKLGQSKVTCCDNCGKKVKLIYDEGKWLGFCRWCNSVIKEIEGDTTKVEGQL